MAYKTFQNGYPLPASDLNNYLMNQSVIVFANAAARTADIPTPIEGMVTYLEDTDAVEVWDGSAWQNINDNSNSVPLSTVAANGDLIVGNGASSVTNLTVGANGSLLYSDGTDASWLANSGTEGDVLAVNATGGLEFVEPAGGGGWQLITSGSVTSANLSITSIPQTYTNLRLVIYNTNQDVVLLRVNNITTSTYEFAEMLTGSSSLSGSQGNSYWQVAFQENDTYAMIEFLNYSNTTAYKMAKRHYARDAYAIFGALFNNDLGLNAITSIQGTGNFGGVTLSFELYGE